MAASSCGLSELDRFRLLLLVEAGAEGGGVGGGVVWPAVAAEAAVINAAKAAVNGC